MTAPTSSSILHFTSWELCLSTRRVLQVSHDLLNPSLTREPLSVKYDTGRFSKPSKVTADHFHVQIHLSTESWAWTAAENRTHTGGVNWICAAARDVVTSEWQVHVRWFARIFGQTDHPFKSPEVLKLAVPVSVCLGIFQKSKEFFSQRFIFLSFIDSPLGVFSSVWRQVQSSTVTLHFFLKLGASCACTSIDNKLLSCHDWEAGKFFVFLVCGSTELRESHPVNWPWWSSGNQPWLESMTQT